MTVKHIHCPVNGWDCPYYTDEGHPCRCLLEDPMADCDDFAAMTDTDDDYTDDDWSPCETCSNVDQENEDAVACCSCCETANFYSKR